MANNQSVRRHLDAFTRGRIIGKLEEGRSVTSVAAEFGIAHSIVSRLWRQFSKIGSRVGRNQTTVLQICDRWMQKGTTYRRGRSHPPQCPTSCEDRQIMSMAVIDRSVTSQTVAQHFEPVMHHSVSARTIRRRLQQSGLSARRPLLVLPLTQNHRRLRRQ
ncbi:transposable element Tcb1 transposase [Trichonephila clavipes]|nr:transposable element Tcb1 transposase [Trichonephila clavipes]